MTVNIVDIDIVQLEKLEKSANMSEELYIEDFDDTSVFENKAGLAEDMRFLASIPELCDVTFLVGETREPVCAVKAVLAARSRVFRKMLFETPVKPREQPQKESKLKAFIKRGSEPLLGRQLAQQRLRLPSHLSNQNQPANSQEHDQQHQTMIIEEFEPDVFRQLIEY